VEVPGTGKNPSPTTEQNNESDRAQTSIASEAQTGIDPNQAFWSPREAGWSPTLATIQQIGKGPLLFMRNGLSTSQPNDQLSKTRTDPIDGT
jgi:hypothetical protein